MSKSAVRTDKTCLNCNHVVENRFCPNCGQENTETRKTFHHLFVHFFEDLTHYENAFWKTIRNLITRPGALTKVYLSGKRMSYLAPVRLYIFISFVTFFLFAILPAGEGNDNTQVNLKTPSKGLNYSWQNQKEPTTPVDSIELDKRVSNSKIFGYQSSKELDSLQQFGPEKDKLSNRQYKLLRKVFEIRENNTRAEIAAKFRESFAHNFPKVLFIYMPMFAFVLWIFYNKKRWYYFDHGIFTLHYFSFLLLMALIARIFVCLFGYLEHLLFFEILNGLVGFAIFVYMLYYFFPALHRFYGESRGLTIVKGLVMFAINLFLAGILMLGFIIYTFLNIH